MFNIIDFIKKYIKFNIKQIQEKLFIIRDIEHNLKIVKIHN